MVEKQVQEAVMKKFEEELEKETESESSDKRKSLSNEDSSEDSWKPLIFTKRCIIENYNQNFIITRANFNNAYNKKLRKDSNDIIYNENYIKNSDSDEMKNDVKYESNQQESYDFTDRFLKRRHRKISKKTNEDSLVNNQLEGSNIRSSNRKQSNAKVPKRIFIFEGGFKSNEEYTYIRGRGKGNLPVRAALYLSGINSEEVHKNVEDYLILVGRVFQIQDDFLDFFGDSELTGKIGTDIEEGKCSWLIVNALEMGNKIQISTLKENYGSKDKTKLEKIKRNSINSQGKR
ncbi:hypothetical protein RND71_044171 [Anisodus tanguticus]|uniref:Uncharacterized protein n=1 Tax=Anisodus tanguticus TaxID=243964 RepID=A0AAE1QNS0_9SOLA|nr:hypothetical protein RND71_044171 [Anisodus tanguticus]